MTTAPTWPVSPPARPWTPTAASPSPVSLPIPAGHLQGILRLHQRRLHGYHPGGLNDALLLDVDVINMSLGSNGGFGREAEGDLTTKYYDLVKSAGILLNCSAGNSYSSSQGGAKGDFTSVSDPDTGIISSSSSYDAALSVASVNANETAAFVTARGRVPYQDVSGHDFTALLLGNDSSRTYEYVMVPNTGDTADYQAWTSPARSPWSCAAACPSSRSSSMPPLPALRAASSITTATAIC